MFPLPKRPPRGTKRTPLKTRPRHARRQGVPLQSIQNGTHGEPSRSLPQTVSLDIQDEDYRRIFDALGDGIILSDGVTGRVLEANAAAIHMHGYARSAFLGLPLSVYIHPDHLPLIPQPLSADEGVYQGEETHVRRDGSQMSVDVHRQVFLYQARWCHLSVLRASDDPHHAKHLLQQELTLHQREAATLLEVSQGLASAIDFQPGFILDQVQILIHSTQAVLLVKEAHELVVLAVRGTGPLEQALPVGTHLTDAEVLRPFLNAHQPLKSSSIHDADPNTLLLRTLFRGLPTLRLDGIHACIWIPLAGKGRVMGGILAIHTDIAHFTDHHVALALTVANQVAITLVNAELHQQAQSLAVLEERQRLAQDLHDAINQSLFSAGLIAEVLPRLWEQDPEAGRRSLADLHRLTRGAAAEMRGLLAALRPSDVADADMEELLHQLADALMGRTDLAVAVTLTGQGVLPAPVQVMFYRVCQEALNNVAKHAQARRVAIHLKFDFRAVILKIQDDGCGFAPNAIPHGHMGLSIMRERAASVGAHLSITSKSGRGTTISLRWVGATMGRLP